MSFSDLELLNRMLASLESRRDKALRFVADYRDSLAKQIRQTVIHKCATHARPTIRNTNWIIRLTPWREAFSADC